MKRLLSMFLLAFCALLTPGIGLANSIVFVTNGTYTGNLGGLAGADAKCQASAATASLAGTYRAFLGGTGVNPGDRIIHSSFPYQLVSGTIVANNYADLTDTTLAAAISRSETNIDLTQSSTLGVWTASTTEFTYFGQNCNSAGQLPDWSTTNSRTNAGTLTSTNSNWINSGILPCASALRLYCIQQVADTARISGRVLSASGRPITHARIIISGVGLPSPLTFFTNRDGNYVSTDLPGGSTYTVSVAQRRFSFTPSSQQVVLGAGDVINANFNANP